MWKQIHQEEHVDAKAHMLHVSTAGWNGPSTDFLAVPITGLVGKHIRVTVEEEVFECYEKWREMLTYGGTEARRIHDAAFPHAPLEAGRNIRIRMEEEVFECCEKWRGMYIYAKSDARILLPSATHSDMRIQFCPECGRLLK